MTLIPEFNFSKVFLEPWSSSTLINWNGQIMLMGFMVCWTCGIVGSFIVIRRMALMGDAISHGILPGLAIAFIISGSMGLGSMFFGACIALDLHAIFALNGFILIPKYEKMLRWVWYLLPFSLLESLLSV